MVVNGSEWAVFTEDLLKMLPTKLRFIWPNGFRGEEFKKSANQKQESSVAAIFVNGSGRNEQSLEDLPTKFQFIWLRDFRGED